MSILVFICVALLAFEIGVLGYSLTARKFSSKASYAYARWLPIFLCVISIAFNAINYDVAREGTSLHVTDIVTAGVAFVFGLAAVVMASFSAELANGFIETRSLLGRNRVELNASTTAVLQTRTRGSWWIVISSGKHSLKISGVINNFRRFCSDVNDQMSRYGNGISVVDALGQKTSFSELRN